MWRGGRPQPLSGIAARKRGEQRQKKHSRRDRRHDNRLRNDQKFSASALPRGAQQCQEKDRP